MNCAPRKINSLGLNLTFSNMEGNVIVYSDDKNSDSIRVFYNPESKSIMYNINFSESRHLIETNLKHQNLYFDAYDRLIDYIRSIEISEKAKNDLNDDAYAELTGEDGRSLSEPVKKLIEFGSNNLTLKDYRAIVELMDEFKKGVNEEC